MDTYGDMVTLLLCFFVLLYSISTIDQQKWRLVVESFNPSAVQSVDQVVINADVSDQETDALEGNLPPEMEKQDMEFEDLYLMLKRAVEERGIQNSVELSKGDGFTFISFRDQVFFDGDSSILRDEGKLILDDFAEALRVTNRSISQIEVLGHTSQASPNRPSNIRNDRMLSAQRSAEVIIYLQSKDAVEPEKLVGLSYGQYRPIDTFDTEEGRARNRRVEILIMKTNSQERSLEEYYEQVYDREFESTAESVGTSEMTSATEAEGTETSQNEGSMESQVQDDAPTQGDVQE